MQEDLCPVGFPMGFPSGKSGKQRVEEAGHICQKGHGLIDQTPRCAPETCRELPTNQEVSATIGVPQWITMKDVEGLKTDHDKIISKIMQNQNQ